MNVRMWMVVVTVGLGIWAPAALADSIDYEVRFTGDARVRSIWLQEGSSTATSVSMSGLSNKNDWTTRDDLTLSLTAGSTYQVVFRVDNDGSDPQDDDPAAFLAQIDGPDGFQLLTNAADWDWAMYGGSSPTDFDTLTWGAATELAYNGQSSGNPEKYWYQNNGDSAISGIASGSSGAYWIWNSAGFGGEGAGDAGELWIRTTITVPMPVPEPSTLSLLALGVVGLAWRRRRRRLV